MNHFRHFIVVTLLLGFYAGDLHAQSKVFTHSATYKIIDADDEISARANAVVSVRRQLVSDVCAFLRDDAQLVALCGSSYEQTMSAVVLNMVELTITGEKWQGATSITVDAQMTINLTTDAVNMAKVLRDKITLTEMLAVQSRIASLEAALEEAHTALAGKVKKKSDASKKTSAKDRKNQRKTDAASRKEDPQTMYDNASDNLTIAEPYLKGNVNYYNGFFSAALQAYTGMLVLDSDNVEDHVESHVEAHNAIGNAHVKMGNIEKAMENFQKALSLNQASPSKETFFYIGRGYNTQGYYSQAITNFERALALDKSYTQAYIGLSTSYIQQGSYGQALQTLQHALTIDPTNAQAYLNLGKLYIRQNKLTEATSSLQRSIELDPNVAEAYCDLGAVYLQKKLHKNALEMLRKANTMEPEMARPYLLQADTYMTMKKPNSKSAVSILKKYILINPNSAEAYRKLADIYQKTKKAKLAKKYAGIAKQLEDATK
jgi:tetratricopeptide (TPR) repeat protein